ncbi:LCP family protein [Cellulomonas soli]|uniref:LCP family protein n=1 Tax=Cellulomonas soli TaxID=931535 RepID=UPI003F8719E7
MTTRHAASPRPRVVRHARTTGTHRVLRGLAITMTGVVTFGLAGAASVYAKMNSNMDSVSVAGLVDPIIEATPADPDDPNAGKDVNILIMGSDVRDGENASIGGEASGMRSDTTIVVHVSADRQRVELVSIPRDSLVDVPACRMTDGSSTGAYNGMFNSAFATGADNGGDIASAAACTINTVQKNTNVRIDHFVVVDFVGFISMVDALGGVNICIPEAIDSPKAALVLSAGNQTLNGSQALGYARARTGEGLGDGSDTNRLGRQQRLIAAVVNEVLSKNLLTDLPSLLQFASAATSSLTTDPGLASVDAIPGLAYSLRGVSTSNVSFMTIPFAAAPNDPNRVVWTSEADEVWANIASDVPMLGVEETPSATQTTAPSDPTTAPPADTTTTAPVDPTTVVPEPVETKEAGKEAFDAGDVTGVCAP